MSNEPYHPAVGDIVAIEMPPIRGEVTRVMKHLAEVSTHPTCNERRFSLPSLREVGASGYRVAHITPWTEEHDREARLAKAVTVDLEALDALHAASASVSEWTGVDSSRSLPMTSGGTMTYHEYHSRHSPCLGAIVALHTAYPAMAAELRRLRDENAALREWEWEGQTPEDAAVAAALPARSGRHDTYQEAIRMVGARRSKGALVALVNWLLIRAEAKP